MLALVILNIIIYTADKVPGGKIQEESFFYSPCYNNYNGL